MNEIVLCKCGCGEAVKSGNVYINGHQNIGRTRDKKPNICYVCGHVLDESNWAQSRRDSVDRICKTCNNHTNSERRRNNYVKSTDTTTSYYLGVVVAERMLSMVFKNVERMKLGNKGYDFICNHGKKIDVKSSATGDKRGYWMFTINNNVIADYFLCLAFNNRDSLDALHLWLIPGDVVNDNGFIRISKRCVCDWVQYELPINDAIICCDSIKLRAKQSH